MDDRAAGCRASVPTDGYDYYDDEDDARAHHARAAAREQQAAAAHAATRCGSWCLCSRCKADRVAAKRRRRIGYAVGGFSMTAVVVTAICKVVQLAQSGGK